MGKVPDGVERVLDSVRKVQNVVVRVLDRGESSRARREISI